MRQTILVFSALILCAPASAAPIVIDTVPVGNPGNAGEVQPIQGTFGGVAYTYRIGKHEVTNDQYAAYLTEKAKSDPFGLYNANMGSDIRGGITRSGVSGSFTYAAKPNMGNKPVNYVSWYDTIRFANWLNNGQGTADTETGAYTLGDLGPNGVPTNGSSISRNAGATWFLPSENEWYKSAYHQPAIQGGDSDDYWRYPTATNSTPTVAMATIVGDIGNPGANVANYLEGADWNGQDGNVTTVGSAGSLSASFYGTFDQGGNLLERNEALIGSFRGVRGGSWSSDDPGFMLSSFRGSVVPLAENNFSGFRVATVPEPSTFVLAAVGGLLLALRVIRRRAN